MSRYSLCEGPRNNRTKGRGCACTTLCDADSGTGSLSFGFGRILHSSAVPGAGMLDLWDKKHLSKEISGSDVPGRVIRQSSTSSQFRSATLPFLSMDPAQYKAAQSQYLLFYCLKALGNTLNALKLE